MPPTPLRATVTRTPARERGQVLVLFALAATALLAMLGLVLDGGDTFAQQRHQQNGADVAALAGADAYLNASGSVAERTAAARSEAVAAARRNGFETANGSTVTVTVGLRSSGASVKVDITRPHRNGFAGIMGFGEWQVSVSASAISGSVDTAAGAAPWIMSVGAFNADGTPKYTRDNPMGFGEVNGDYPVSGLDIAWTDFNGADNVNAAEVKRIITGATAVTATIGTDQYIGQHNNGNMTTVYDDIAANLVGRDMPVPLTGPCPAGSAHADGCFKGWAMFQVLGATGGSTKQVRGYFLSDLAAGPLGVGECTVAQQAAGTCGVVRPSVFGAYQVRLDR